MGTVTSTVFWEPVSDQDGPRIKKALQNLATSIGLKEDLQPIHYQCARHRLGCKCQSFAVKCEGLGLGWYGTTVVMEQSIPNFHKRASALLNDHFGIKQVECSEITKQYV